MELRRSLEVLLRRWWLIVGLPLIVLAGSVIRTTDQPFTATTRATILIPGDTETTGNADRPELMILDDAPVVVTSQKFADAVMAALPSTAPDLSLTEDEIHNALSASRYSRVLTINATRPNEREAIAIAQAAAVALPNAINQYMVAAGTQPATVRIIDPPNGAVQGNSHQKLILTVELLVALSAGIGLAALAAALDERLYTVGEIEAALSLPVLEDVRSGRRGRWLQRFWGGNP